MGSCAAPSAKRDDKFITTDYLQQCRREAVKREVERRVKERMILSRNRNYSRLATASP